MLSDNDVLHGNTILCPVSQRSQLVAGEESEISVSKTYSPTQISLDEFQILSVYLMRRINARKWHQMKAKLKD
jgi:uncharacterized protein YqeY